MMLASSSIASKMLIDWTPLVLSVGVHLIFSLRVRRINKADLMTSIQASCVVLLIALSQTGKILTCISVCSPELPCLLTSHMAAPFTPQKGIHSSRTLPFNISMTNCSRSEAD